MTHKGMKFGIFLAPFHRIGENPTLALDRDMELIEWLDYLGYDEVWVGEHHSAGWELIASPEIFIAAAAERTKHIMLGSGVTSLPYHHPLLVAQRFAQLEPVRLHRHRLVAREQLHDRLQRLFHARALRDRLDAHHVGIGDERAGTAAEHRAAARHVIELDEALRHQQGVVVGQARHARAERTRHIMLGSGEAISSQPAEWCSPTHTSS